MRYFFLILLFPLFILAQSPGDSLTASYNFNKKYTTEQLRQDFLFLRHTLESKHPRLYEYTPKKQFNVVLDSLFGAIKDAMTEREFHYFLLPVIGKVHCAHTKMMSSQYLLDHINDYCKAPPFLVYFDVKKAYLASNFSTDTSIHPGAELLSVNKIPVSEIRNGFLARMPQEGRNTTFIYNRINTGVWLNNGLFGLFPGLCDYPVTDTYQIAYIIPGSKAVKTSRVASIAYNDYQPVIFYKEKKKYGFYVNESTHTGILTIATFLVQDEFSTFADSVFKVLDSTRIPNLIIDLRGNVGGLPEPSAELLTHLMPKDFVYFKEVNGYDDYKRLLHPAVNRFKGKLIFLIDGACRSTTGHFLALAKYYKIGTMIGEETCSSWSCNDNGSAYTLPNTKLIFQCPASTATVAVGGMKRGRGIMPDYVVKPTIKDIVEGKDVVMQYAFKLIATGKKKS